jgi:hypothetical protein
MSKLGVCGGLLIREAWFESTMGSQEQRIGYVIQYESQGTAVNPWAGNSTFMQRNRWWYCPL